MEIEVANKKIGENHPVLIIAEAGVCHDGDIEKAKELVDIAKDCGVDIVKFQTWKTEELCLEDSEKAEYQKEQTGTDENQFDMIKKLELSYEDFIELRSYCDKKGIIFMSTPDEEKSAKFLIESVNIPAIKIGSGEITNHHYQKYLAAFKRPLIISTGMGTMEDVKTIKEITDGQNNDKVIFLHCTTDYPAKYEDSNINAMVTMKKELGTIIGYSDHTMGIYVPLVAVALGAEVIEKHFTYSRLAEGPDHKASLTPDQLKEMVEEIRELEKIPPEERKKHVRNAIGNKMFDLIAGSHEKKATEREEKNKSYMQKSIVIKEDTPAGTKLEEGHLLMKRADKRGIAANKYTELLGKETLRNMKKDEIITFDDIK